MSIVHALFGTIGLPTFARGIHPPTRKQRTADLPIETLPPPPAVTIPLHQHAGAPAEPVVKPRDEVGVGDAIGRAVEGTISAAVHASVAGKVQPLTATTLPNGRRSLAVPIQASQESPSTAALFDELYGGTWPLEETAGFEPPQIVEAAKSAGIVGMGGAAFPAHIKLAPPAEKPIETLLANGSECEPYLTADYRLMVEAPQAILAGILLAQRACGADRAVIAIEDNKPQAVAALGPLVDGCDDVKLVVCETKYPMGGERQLIPAVFGRQVPTGGLPMDVGIVVVNVATAAALAAAVMRRQALTHRIITVSGGGIHEPKNLLVPIGVSVDFVIENCGGLTEDAARVIAGGPMMGFTITDLAVPVTKGTGGLTVLSRDEVEDSERTACIRCGECLDACPLRLAPTKIAHAAKFGELDLAKRYDMAACCECGCCAFVCPARLPLVQYIRAGKAAVMRS